MNLASTIHARWAALPSLSALLPAEQVTSGAHFAGRPGESYAVVTLPGGTPAHGANDGSSLVNRQVRILVHHPDCGAGRAIVAAVEAGFDRSDFDLAAGGRVLCMQLAAGPQEVQDSHTGHWEWSMDFECLLYLTKGNAT